MKDTLRDECDDAADCVRNCCVSPVIAPIFFVIFVLMAQFVLVNVVVAVLMKHLEESHKQIEDDEFDMEELEREMMQTQKFEEEQALCMQLEDVPAPRRSMPKVLSLPSNFTYSSPIFEAHRFNAQRRQTVQLFGDGSRFSDFSRASTDERMAEIELGEMKPKTKRRRSSSGMSARDKEMPTTSRTPNVRPKFNREISLDERQMTTSTKPITAHKLTDLKRTSCDQLLVRDDKTTNFYHKPNVKPNEKCASKVKSEKLSTSKDSIVMAAENARVSLYRRSSLKSDYGKPNTTNTLLSLSKAQSVSGRSGSCRQLFKQHAMDDEADIDENSLLLPVLNKPQIQHNDAKNAKETSLFNKTTNETE